MTRTTRSGTCLLCAAATAAALLLLCSQFCAESRAQLATTDRLSDPGWWPTQSTASRAEYVGAAACARCHAAISSSQKETAMANTAFHVRDSVILQAHPKMAFRSGAYHYEIKTAGAQSQYTVTDGKRSLTFPLLWAFGASRVGQSYLFHKNGDEGFYEARVTYFDTLKNLHFTPGRALASPKNIDEAMSRLVPPGEVARCFACHTTGANIGTDVNTHDPILGVSCEACHGPGAKHVAAMEAAKLSGISIEDKGIEDKGTIFNAGALSPVDSVDFCGACHGTWWDVKITGVSGVGSLRFQPYRLQNSRCWGRGDPRITCVACHNPHQPLVTDSAFYDQKCLDCHLTTRGAKLTADHPGPACPVSSVDCASCHMPRFEDPDMHYKFTDHQIRVVRAGEPFPK